MKKLFSMGLAIALLIGLTACGGGGSDSTAVVETQEIGKAGVGFVTVPVADWEQIHEDGDFNVTFYNNDNDAVLDIFNAQEEEGEITLDDMAAYFKDFQEEFSSAENMKIEDGKFGDVDAKIITGEYLDESFNETFEIYGWAFVNEKGHVAGISIEARSDDMDVLVRTIDGTYVVK